jgi:uncharacterized protein
MTKIYVLDTNTVISAIFWPDSIPALAVKKAQVHTIAVSQAVTDEWNEVIRRSKFDKLKPLAIRLALLEELISGCQLTPVTNPINVCRDPKDDKFLEVASAANATLIVSGDKGLLDLISFEGIPIITARVFLETH